MTAFELSDDQRYRALKARDRRFDGVFVVGVRTTGIYCRPSCPTPVQPLRKNIDFFPTTAAAQRSGLRACKRCRPDATPGSPEWSTRDDVVARAMQLIGRGRLDTGSVADLAADVGVTERHLRRMMLDVVGAPPLSIARAQRAQTARTLIETTAMSFTDVAFAAGFSSLRQFNDTIREVFATTPTELRAKSTAAASPVTGTLSIRLPFRSPMAWEHACAWWSGRLVPTVAHVHDGAIVTALRLPRGTGVATLSHADTWIDCGLELDDVADLAPAVAQCRAMLDLDADPVEIDETLRALPVLRPFVDRLPGLRAPGSTDGFMTLVFAVLGQQRSVAAARTIAGRLVDRAGAEEQAGLRLFPTPRAVLDIDFEGIGLNGRAIETIRTLAARFDGRTDELAPGADRAAILEELLSVKGVGPWTANYVAMRVFGDPDIHLAGDLIADRTADALGLTADQIDSVRPWRTYLTHHLWAASAVVKGNQ